MSEGLLARSGRFRHIFDFDLAKFRAKLVRTTLRAALRRRPHAAPRARALCPLRNHFLAGPSLSHLYPSSNAQRSGPRTKSIGTCHRIRHQTTGAAETSSTSPIPIGSREGTLLGSRVLASALGGAAQAIEGQRQARGQAASGKPLPVVAPIRAQSVSEGFPVALNHLVLVLDAARTVGPPG